MREILFRGKHLDKWVYGGYSKHIKDDDRHFITNMTKDRISDIGHHQEIDPATLGEYTGLLDKNSKRIFEGDVICIDGAHHNLKIVKWSEDHLQWHLENIGMDTSFKMYIPYKNTKNFEIISNIHEVTP